jgi:hypothetical protein
MTSLESPPSLFPSNYQRLAFHSDWPTTWTHIVAGRFSGAPYDGLLLYDQSSGYAEFHETDGAGGVSPVVAVLEERPSWTHIVAGKFSDSTFSSLLLYDQQAGFAAVYDTDGCGKLIKLQEYDGWRSSWTHITTVRIPGSNYSALVLYDQAAGHGEILRCKGSGEFELWKSSDGWRTSWTHVVGDFRSGACLLFYEASTAYCEIYTFRDPDDPNRLGDLWSRADMPPATEIIPGNFGWSDTGFLFYDRPTGHASFVFLGPSFVPETPLKVTVGPEEYTDWLTTWDIIVPGNFWEPDPEYARFQNGFTDLLFYDRSQGYSEFWLHEPFGSILVQDLEGYVSSGSVAPGETINFYVNSRVGPYTIRVFQQDAEEVLVATLQNIDQFPEPFPIGRLDYRDGPSWPPVAELVIPDAWPSGLYLARVEATNAGIAIPFVVRAAVPGSQSRILVFIPDTTYEAYNFWGGRSLYGFRSSIDPGFQYLTWSYGSKFAPKEYDDHQLPRAFQVSFRRPYNEEPQSNKWQYWEVPLLRWLALQGIAVEVCTATDLHKDGANHTGLLANYQLLVSVGHDEYWSKEMRDNVESFTAAGGNVAFFSGNVCWFQIRFDLNVRRQICYKDARFDPFYPAQSQLVTVNWWDQPVCRAETSLTGVSYFDPVEQETCYRVLRPDHWVFGGLGFDSSSMFGEYTDDDPPLTVVGYETDKYQKPDADPCRPSSPDNFERLAEVLAQDGSRKVACTMGTFTHGKGQVFTAATLNWSLGLSQDGVIRNPIDRITRNVFERLGGVEPEGGVADVVDFDGAGNVTLDTTNSGWRTTWDEIVVGNFVGNGREQVLLYDRADGEADVAGFDDFGQMNLDTTNSGWRTSWDVIVVGNFIGNGRQQILLYDRNAGEADVVGFDDSGVTNLDTTNSGWRSSWDVIVVGDFIGNGRDQVLLYDRSAGEADVVGFDDSGQANLDTTNTGLRTSWADIVSAALTGNDRLQVLLYDRNSNQADVVGFDDAGNINLDEPIDPFGSNHDGFVAGDFLELGRDQILRYDRQSAAADVFGVDSAGDIALDVGINGWRATWDLIVVGNLLGNGVSQVLLYDRDAGQAGIYGRNDFGNIALLASIDGWRTTWEAVVAGDFVGNGRDQILLYARSAS